MRADVLVLAMMAVAPLAMAEVPGGTGAHPALMEMDKGLPTHTVYRPASLAALNGNKLPIVAFANGGCRNLGNRFRPFLTEIASHGYLAIAIGPIGTESAEAPPAPGAEQASGEPAPGSPAALRPELAHRTSLAPGETRPPFTYAKQLIHAIDWAIAENSRAGSPYFGKIDTTKIAVFGQSCGGLQAIDAAHDPRVTTLGVWNSGVFPATGRSWEIAAAHADKADLASLHGSVLYVSGDPTDVAFDNAEDDFKRINHIPVVRAWREKTPHAGTYREPNGGAFSPVAVAWLDWQLKGDQNAAKMFAGSDCGLCKKSEWHVSRKGIAQ
ncbi:alpha/beta hydrolase [Pseudoduganella sp. UC29_106]|uniref:alpha/beta hydrolase n=1 Tax=Pseudoduganella sp. UC29_106 TaxID=3374553 RepID=UPI0037577316